MGYFLEITSASGIGSDTTAGNGLVCPQTDHWRSLANPVVVYNGKLACKCNGSENELVGK